jgi:methanogenic corrinoid protein MtbC1
LENEQYVKIVHGRYTVQKTILSTADVARLFNVTETTVKRWADEGTLICQKTPGGHRKFLISSVVDFAEKNKFEPVGTLELPSTETDASAIQVAVLSRDFPVLVDAFTMKALSPAKLDLVAFLSFLYEHRIHLWEIFDLILRPAMTVIGERWEKGQIQIDHEHRVSYETLDALANLQTRIKIKPKTGKSAIFACLGEEMHEIGLRCASYLFESEGWTTHYIGARTPSSSLISAMKELQPDVVCISTTLPDSDADIVMQMREVSTSAHAMHAMLLVGGLGARPEFIPDRTVDVIVTSAKDLLDFMAASGRNNQRAGGTQ